MSSAACAHENDILAFSEMFAESAAWILIWTVWVCCRTQTHLFGYSRRILAKGFSYASERTLLEQLLFNINSVREGKVLTVTFYLATHEGLLSDRQITLFRVHIKKKLCKIYFHFVLLGVAFWNSHYLGDFLIYVWNVCFTVNYLSDIMAWKLI